MGAALPTSASTRSRLDQCRNRKLVCRRALQRCEVFKDQPGCLLRWYLNDVDVQRVREWEIDEVLRRRDLPHTLRVDPLEPQTTVGRSDPPDQLIDIASEDDWNERRAPRPRKCCEPAGTCFVAGVASEQNVREDERPCGRRQLLNRLKDSVADLADASPHSRVERLDAVDIQDSKDRVVGSGCRRRPDGRRSRLVARPCVSRRCTCPLLDSQ